MNRKIITSIAFLFLIIVSSTSVLPLIAQNQVTLTEEIPNEVVVLVCQALEKDKIASSRVAMDWYRTGQMTITKVDSGVYRLILPGGGITVLIMDEL